MKNEIGLIVVKIDNPVQTGRFINHPIYNGVFVNIKGKYYIPVHILLSEQNFVEYLVKLNEKKGYGDIVNLFEQFHNTYYNNEYFKTAKIVEVVPSNRVTTGMFLKALNLLDQYKPFSDVARLFNKGIARKVDKDDWTKESYSNTIAFLDESVKHYLYQTLAEYHSKRGRRYWKLLLSQTQVKMMEVAVEYLRSKDDGIIELNKINHPYVTELLNKELGYKHPVYKHHTIQPYGSTYSFGVNGNLEVMFNPRFSGRILVLKKKFKPKYFADVVDFKSYYNHYRPKRVRGVSPVIEYNKPVFCYNIHDDSFYILARTRFKNPVIVRIPADSVSTTNNFKASKVVFNGKSYPIAYTDYADLIASIARIKKDKSFYTLL